MGNCLKERVEKLLHIIEHEEKPNKKKERKKKERNGNNYNNDNIGSEVILLRKKKTNLNKPKKNNIILNIEEEKLSKKKSSIDEEKSKNEELKQEDKKLQDEKSKNNENLEKELEKVKLENMNLIKLKSYNEEKDKILQNKEEILKQQNDEIIKLKQNIQKKDNDLTANEKNNNDINDINDLKNNLSEKNQELIKKEQELSQKDKRIKELEDKLKEIEEKEDPILIGLDNIGATCYMNASLQCLSNTKKLSIYFLEHYQKEENKIMANEYYEVIKNLWDINNKNKSYSPNSFKDVLGKENPLFAGIAANDSKDLINFLLERLHQELNFSKNINNINNDANLVQLDQTNEQVMLKLFLDEFKEKFDSIISNLFYGIIETKSQCQGCNIIKYNFQVSSLIEFPLQQVNQYFFNKGKRPLLTEDGKNPDIDIYECFEYYGKIDLMSGDNQMFCNQCNKLCNSYYSTSLYSGSNYLIINLNRGKGAVYECKVIFPEILNLFNFFTDKHGVTVYELYAVICHLGPSSMSGHFVAYCKNRIDNKWYLYNDSIVSLCERKDQYNDGMPYILFYKVLKSGKNSEF